MEIYVVKPGDTINSIAEAYKVPVEKLVRDNGLINPESLVPGQTIVITQPKQVYVVKEGDTLTGIADTFGVPVMQLLRNNPFLSEREYIYPGEALIISYDTGRKISTVGFAYPYINKKVLQKTLPSLTYLTVFNYRAVKGGEITEFEDASEIIRMAKDYGTIPLMITGTLTAMGELDLETAYEILLNEDIQEHYIDGMISIIKEKGYYGVNMIFYYINTTNQRLYENFITRVSGRLRGEGYLFFATINPNIRNELNEIEFERIDYSRISQLVDNITFLNFFWGSNKEPPAPISSISNLRAYLDYVKTMIPTNIINIGTPVLGYNWELPFVPGRSQAVSLTLNSAISLAYDVEAEIQFDEPSQTPFYEYSRFSPGVPNRHIVWFVDTRTIEAIMDLISEYGLNGSGIWNIMIFFPQLWLVINSQYEIEKITA
jgi:spore germination protein